MMCTKIMSKPTMISKRPRRLSTRMLILAVYTTVAVVQIVSADNDTSSLTSLIKGQYNTNNSPNDEPAARLLKEKMKFDTNRDLQDSAATNDGTYTINALASRLSKPGQNQGRQDNFKRRKNNGGNGGDKNDRQSSGSGGGGRERQTTGGVGAARNEGRKNRNGNKPQQQGTDNNQKNRKPAVSTVNNNNNAKPQGNRQNKPVGIHGPQKPQQQQQQQQKNNARNKNGINNGNGTRRKKKVPMAARTSNLVVVKNKQKLTNAGKRTPNTATAGNDRNSHANGFMTTLYGSSGGGKGGGGKGNMQNKNGGGKKKKMNNGRKRYNGGKNAWSTPTWSVDEKKVWDAGWGTEGIYKPSSSNGWGASSSASKDSWTDDGWTRADWIELPEREECPCVMVDNPEYIQAQWSSSGQWCSLS